LRVALKERSIDLDNPRQSRFTLPEIVIPLRWGVYSLVTAVPLQCVLVSCKCLRIQNSDFADCHAPCWSAETEESDHRAVPILISPVHKGDDGVRGGTGRATMLRELGATNGLLNKAKTTNGPRWHELLSGIS